jgi:hypothetical protein
MRRVLAEAGDKAGFWTLDILGVDITAETEREA